MTAEKRRLAIDVVVPLYNEEQVVAEFHRRLMDVLTPLRRQHDVSIYYVNDGSVDHTGAELSKLTADDPDITVLELSRNFGHQAALTAGLDRARGDAVITLDGDGQHPPELIVDMVALYEAGYEVVLTQRVSADQPRFKRWTSTGFYRLLSAIADTPIPAGSADYRLVARPVLEALREMREYHRFLRGMVAWAGYKTVVLPYAERERLGGEAKYSLRRMARLASDAMFSFSLVPIGIALVIGLSFLVLAAAEALWVASFWLSGRQHLLVPGWSSLMFMVLIVGGTLMIAIGLVGFYVGYIFQEVKRRPVYLVRAVPGPRRPLARAAVNGPHQIHGPSLHLLKNVADVNADQPDGDHERAADDQHHEHERAPARHQQVLSPGEPEAGDPERLGGGQNAEGQPDDERDPDRHQRKREHRVGRQPRHPPQRVLRFPAEPFALGVRKHHGLVSGPGHHAAQEAMVFAHLAQRLEDGSGHEPVVGRAGGDRRVGDRAQEPVEGRRGPPLEARLIRRDPLGEHDLIAGLVQGHHVDDQLGRMLPVAVEGDDGVASRSVEPRGEGGLMAEVAAQLEDGDVRVVGGQLRELGTGVVHGAVVDVVDADVVLPPQRRQHVHQPAMELGHDLFLVVERDDDVDGESAFFSRHVRLSTPRSPAARAGGPAIRTRRSGRGSRSDRSGSSRHPCSRRPADGREVDGARARRSESVERLGTRGGRARCGSRSACGRRSRPPRGGRSVPSAVAGWPPPASPRPPRPATARRVRGAPRRGRRGVA